MVELEIYLEIVNCIIAVVIALIGIGSLKNLKGNLRKAWMFFVGARVLFALHEVNGTLMELNVFNIDGLYSFTEFIYIAAFLIATIIFRKLFIELSENKKIIKEKNN